MKRHPGPRLLETSSQVLGFEIPEILILTFQMSALSYLFSWSSYRNLISWGLTLITALILIYLKKGKPRGFLLSLFFKLRSFHGVSLSPELSESASQRVNVKGARC